jgi:hypothetical protein
MAVYGAVILGGHWVLGVSISSIWVVCTSFYDGIRSHTTSYVALKSLNKFIFLRVFLKDR